MVLFVMNMEPVVVVIVVLLFMNSCHALTSPTSSGRVMNRNHNYMGFSLSPSASTFRLIAGNGASKRRARGNQIYHRGESQMRWGEKTNCFYVDSLRLYSNNSNDSDNETVIISQEAQELLARAKQIRQSLKLDEKERRRVDDTPSSDLSSTNINRNAPIISPFHVPPHGETEQGGGGQCKSTGYRLYIDIGREDGTWMDPRWGASGKRIECTIDISFLSSGGGNDNMSLASQDVIDEMVKDNLSGKSSVVRIMNTAPKARLRNGFDQMNVYRGGYRIDIGGGSSNTVRFYLNVDGTEGSSSTYGDVSIPNGNLYFSLPCFGNSIKQLSSKEGVVTVRQIGWHTGWRREESRIVGVFRAVPINQAKKRDGF